MPSCSPAHPGNLVGRWSPEALIHGFRPRTGETWPPFGLDLRDATDTSQDLLAVAARVLRHYGEELWRAVKTSLGVVTSLSLRKRQQCLVLVHEGTSGKGKSAVVRLMMPDRTATRKYVERADDFTPASFVSHAANRSTRQLAQIDLLPRVKDKVMLTKELAPLFRGDDKELRKNFARLTSILDGDGYKTNSGTHGGRGYEGRYVFHWIGATTPIPEHTHKVMAQLGNRLLFYWIDPGELTEEELIKFARNDGTANALEECRKAVNDFIEDHFKRHPVDSVDPETIAIPEPELTAVVRYARLIAHGRVEVEHEDWGNREAGDPEGPHRIILLLQTLARGLALADGRSAVTQDDLDLVRHVAFSSMPRRRRELLCALIQAGGTLTSAKAEKAQGVSRPTSIDSMWDLAATGIGVFTPGEQSSSTPASIALADGWRWLLTDTPLKASPGCVCSASSIRFGPPPTPSGKEGPAFGRSEHAEYPPLKESGV